MFPEPLVRRSDAGRRRAPCVRARAAAVTASVRNNVPATRRTASVRRPAPRAAVPLRASLLNKKCRPHDPLQFSFLRLVELRRHLVAIDAGRQPIFRRRQHHFRQSAAAAVVVSRLAPSPFPRLNPQPCGPTCQPPIHLAEEPLGFPDPQPAVRGGPCDTPARAVGRAACDPTGQWLWLGSSCVTKLF